MSPPGAPTRPASVSLQRFVRVAACLWLAVLLAIGMGAWLAPHMGRIVDVVLHQTAYRHWTRLVLETTQAFLEPSTPESTVKSYYSALYRRDAAAMARLTSGPLRDQMRQRLEQTPSPVDMATYTSYLQTHLADAQTAVVVEKFHLFWPHGLRFTLQRQDMGWTIREIALLQ